MPPEKVLVAMSGGVDSSVAALLLKEAGYDVVGVTMRLWSAEDPTASPHNRRCCSVQDTADAQEAAAAIGIPHYVINFEREFRRGVVDYFIAEYRRGRTPHPCIACNDTVKFDPLLRRAEVVGARYLATGHYARIEDQGSHVRLLKAASDDKDQSYVLYGLRQDILRRLLFPVGHYAKDEIRTLARQAGLPLADKPDSQDICFIPSGDYRGFIQNETETSPGAIVDPEGNHLGQHQGIEMFTVGQRRNLGIQSDTPRYVVSIDAASRKVVVGSRDDVYSDTLWAEGVSYVDEQIPNEPFSVRVKYRYKSTDAPAIVYPDGSHAKVVFRESQPALTPGQAVVFYEGPVVLGGGVIERVATSTSRTPA